MYFAKAEADLVKNGLNLKTLEPGGTAQNVYMLEAIIKECNRRLEPYERPVADLAATRQPRSISQTARARAGRLAPLALYILYQFCMAGLYGCTGRPKY